MIFPCSLNEVKMNCCEISTLPRDPARLKTTDSDQEIKEHLKLLKCNFIYFPVVVKVHREPCV